MMEFRLATRSLIVNRFSLLLVCLFSLCSAVITADDDILVADFEQATYGDWNVEGDSFGP